MRSHTEVLGWEDGDIEGITTRQFWGETVWKCKNAPIYNTHYRQTYGAVVIQFCFTAADWRATGVCAGIMIGTTDSGGRRANFKEQLEKMLLIRRLGGGEGRKIATLTKCSSTILILLGFHTQISSDSASRGLFNINFIYLFFFQQKGTFYVKKGTH